MKKHLSILTSTTAASLLVFSTIAQQQTPDQTTRPGDTSAAETIKTHPGHTNRFGPTEKASKVIGMAVENPQNEKLGKVDDLAVDLQSGRIVEAVLSVGGFLG